MTIEDLLNLGGMPMVLVLTPLIIGLVKAIRWAVAGEVEVEWLKRISPILAIAIGCALCFLVLEYLKAPDRRWSTIVLYGLVSGLSASGLYSAAVKPYVEPLVARMRGVPAPQG